MVISKKLLRNSRANTLRFIGSVLIISLCISMYVGFTSSMWSLYYELQDYREECRLHDYEVFVSNEISNESELEQKYDILLEHRYYCETECDDGDIIKLMSANSKVDKYQIQQGEDISEKNDLLINEQYALKNNYEIGSEIKIGSDTFKIKGFYIEPDYTLVTNSIKGISVNHTAYGIAVISKERAAEMARAASEYLVYCNSDKENFDKESFLKDLYASSMIEKLIDCESDNRAVYIDGDVMIYTKAMAVIPFFLMTVACFVVAVILGTLLKSETVEIGILYSFGYKPSQLYIYYTFYSFFIALCGGILGIIFGIFLAPVLKSIVTDRYCVPPFEIALEFKTVIISILMPMIFLVTICSIFVIRKLWQNPLTLLKNQSSEKQGIIFRGFELKKASFVGRFRIREIIRNIPKYIFMIFGVSVSALMLLLFSVVISSINKMLDDSFSNIFKYEYMYTCKEMNIGTPDGFRTNITYLMLDDEEISVNGVDINNTHMCFDDADGNPVTFKDHEITVNLANKHNIHAGDTIHLTNRLTGDTYDIKTDRIIMSYAEDFVSMPIDEFNEFFGFPKDSYIVVTSDNELDLDPDTLLSVNSKKNSRESIDETLAPLKLIMVSMMAMAAFVSFIIMTIVISIIIEDSKFTVSMLKIVGYNEKRISKMLIDFNRYIVIIAFAVSVPMIISVSSGIMSKLSEMMGMYIPPYFNPVHAIIGFLLLYIDFLAVKFIMKRRIMAIDPTETIKSSE